MKIALLHGAKKNAGDFLILDRTEKLLKHFYPDCVINRFYRNQILDDVIDEINDNDIMLIAGGPAYNKNFATILAPMFSDLNDIKIPIMCLGLGLYDISSNDSIIYNHFFDKNTKELFKRAMEDSGMLGCRDYYSMHVLRSNGLNRALMTGCPAWYDLDNVNKVEYTGVQLTKVNKICISDCGNLMNVGTLYELLGFTRDFFGNDKEIVFVVHRNEHYSQNDQFVKMLEDCNIKLLDISDSVDGLSVYDDCDLHIGFRVHAHIYNLSKRKISILIEEDVRGQGVNDALGLPHIFAFDETTGQINQYVISHITNVLIDLVSQNYDKLNEAYKAMNNGFMHMKKHILSMEDIIKKWTPKEMPQVTITEEGLLEETEVEIQEDNCKLWLDKCHEMCYSKAEEDDISSLCKDLQAQYDDMCEADKKRILRLLATNYSPREVVYIISVMCIKLRTEGINSLLLRNVLKCDYNWYEGSVINYQLGKFKLDYVEHRRFKLQMSNKYRKELGLDLPYRSIDERNKNRIVVMTDQLLSLSHAPTEIVCKYLYTLQEIMGYEVMVFCCPIDRVVEPSLWYLPNYAASRESFDSGAMRFSYKGAVFEGYQITMQGDALKEYHMMHRMIHMWNPICVLNVCNFNPVVELINDYTTVISQRCSNGLPISDADILLMLDDYVENSELAYKHIERTKQILHKIKGVKPYFERHDVDYSREELGLPEDKFIITVVGNRLDTEVKDEFIELMDEITKLYPEVVYAIIGDVSLLKNKISNTSLSEKTYFLGECKYLFNVYEVLDLYLNPNRERGGYSGAMALAAGIPVVTLPNCDVASNVGDDFIVNNNDEIKEAIGKYMGDIDFINAKKASIKAFNDDNHKDKGFEMLKQRFEEVLGLLN